MLSVLHRVLLHTLTTVEGPFQGFVRLSSPEHALEFYATIVAQAVADAPDSRTARLRNAMWDALLSDAFAVTLSDVSAAAAQVTRSELAVLADMYAQHANSPQFRDDLRARFTAASLPDTADADPRFAHAAAMVRAQQRAALHRLLNEFLARLFAYFGFADDRGFATLYAALLTSNDAEVRTALGKAEHGVRAAAKALGAESSAAAS